MLISHESKSPQSSGRRKSKSKKRSDSVNVLGYLLSHIVQEDTPSHVARVLLATLNKVDTEVCIFCTFHFFQLTFFSIKSNAKRPEGHENN
jgi:hypothetical protein